MPGGDAPENSHRAPPAGDAGVEPPDDSSNPGAGKIGGRSREALRFWTSISLKSIAGAEADTGTLPDSAPQIPLKTSVLSPVNKIRFNEASGVPTMSTPRTNWSGRPSGYTRHTITGRTWNA